MNRAALAAYIDAERRRRARIARASAPFSPSDLFQSGDILLWYDPSDLSTMFKDTAGTQPVTANGDSVALMLDKGQWGGKTLEQVRAAALEKLSSGTIQTLLSPGSTATFNTSTGVGTVYRDASGYSGINFAVAGYVAVDITSDSTALALRNAEQSGTILKTVSVGRNTYIVGPVSSLSLSMSAYSSANITVHSVKVIPGYHRTQATGTSMPKYKTDGTLHWLLYDGTDDSHATGTITWGTDEVAICAGVTKSSDAATGMFVELSTNANGNGAFYVAAPRTGATGNYGALSTGTTLNALATTGAAYPAPTTNMLTMQAEISADTLDLRVDGVSAATDNVTNQGTGNYGSHVLHFGRRASTSLPISGREYQTVIRSRLLSTAELSSLETFVAEKTGVIL